MKKITVFLIVSVLLIAGVSAQTQPVTCTETDGGANFFVAGTMTYIGRQYADFCNGNQLVEYYCQTPTRAAKKAYACPNGCANGACVQSTPSPPPAPQPSQVRAHSCDADAVCEMNDASASVVRSKAISTNGLLVSDSAEIGRMQTPSGPVAALYVSQPNSAVKVRSGLDVENGFAVLTGTSKFKDTAYFEKGVKIFSLLGSQNAFVCIDVNGQLYNSIGPCTTASLGSTGGTGGGSGTGTSGNFWAANGDHIYKTNSGDVGINTANPGARLEVWGRWGQITPLPTEEGPSAPINQYFPAVVQITSNVGGFPAILGMSAQAANYVFMNNMQGGWALGELDDGTFFIGGVRGSGGHPRTLKITGSTNGVGNDDNVGIGLGYNNLPKSKLHIAGDVLIEGGYLIMPDPAGGCAACGPVNGVWTCTPRAACP